MSFLRTEEERHTDDPISKKKRGEMEHIVLVAGLDKSRFPVHRQTMTESSKYFDAMLGPNFREGSENEIVLRDIDGTTLQLVIHFCYAGHTKITTDNVEELIDAASRMEFLRLEQDCCDFLIDNLTVENCVDALLIADKYNFSELNQKALQFIRDHFEAVPNADVLEVSHENFDELLKYAHYRIEESIIFDRLVQWVGHNKVERAKYVPALAEHIRLEHISDEFIQKEVQPFYENYDCDCDFQMRTMQSHIPSRFCRYLANELHFMVPSYHDIQFLKFDTESKQWQQYNKIKIGRKRDHGSALIGDKLYVIGGISNSSIVNKVILYDLSTGTTELLPNMPVIRSNFRPIVIGKFIYVFGGLTHCTTAAEDCLRFDTELRVWETRQSMPHNCNARDYEAIVFNGKIYVAGGLVANAVYSHRFCCYDPSTDTWTEKSQTNFEVSGLVLFTWKGSIYAACADSILRKYDLENDTWHAIGHIDSDQLISNAIECNDELYAFIRGPRFAKIKIAETECSVETICVAPFRTGIDCLFFTR